MAQKVVLKVVSMTDDKTKQKAIEAAAHIHGVDSIGANLEDQQVTVVGEMDAVAVVKKLKKVAGMVEIISIGPAADQEPPPPPPPDQKKKKKKKTTTKKKKKKQEDNKGEGKEEKNKNGGELTGYYPSPSLYSSRMHGHIEGFVN
ncbi:heavy metal-associated isoprenylated plant protein 39-like [Cynara cardunculus var. scolymus]|nr:heavy metal-associated isoprenylated plant protein 39-like [Cynara cardunculus var. scolymus]